jgi:hypothetical protein
MRGVAKAFDIPKSTLDRHLREHVQRTPLPTGHAKRQALPAIQAIANGSAGPTRHEVTQAVTRAIVAAAPVASAEVGAAPVEGCEICAHTEHYAIGVAVRQGATYAAIVGRYGGDLEAVRAHALGCIPSLLAQAGDLAARTVPSMVVDVAGKGAGGLGAVEQLVRDAQQLVTDATANPDPRRRASAITAATGVLQLAARMRGELAADLEIRLVESPAWSKVKTKLAAALLPYPDALAAVATALDGVE